MAVQDIAFVELYTRDKLAMAEYFESAMGFTRVADSVEVDRSSVLLRQGTTQVVVTSGPGTWRFLEDHGEGIADIALTCDDVAVSRDSAIAAGAKPVVSLRQSPAVTAFGDVMHTLLPHTGEHPGTVLPAGRRWAPSPGTSAGAERRIQALDHIAVCLEGGTLAAHADFYEEAFGFSRLSAEYVAVGGQAMDSIVVRSASDRVTFTLVAPDPGKEPGQLDGFLARNAGPGVQHIAFLVEEIIPAVHEFRGRGVEFLSTPDGYYDLLDQRFADLRMEIEQLREAQVLADRDEWGHLLQLFSRSPFERNTLFFELIQRNGSRGFGSANIRALYEAVERDRLAAR
ncbi:4-hydroxyphenylpyruvate dioxygenase [Streptomyces sp. NPDC002138]|uniref:4-hydroxyphenylpyruvate dioxygenase n=1 Tax=Streptomyces sp. NPDC002138 TaxID=3154410 RepID=UPI00332AE054